MQERIMTPQEIEDEIKFEDRCSCNTLLQELFCLQDQKKEVDVYMKLNDKNQNCGYVIRDKHTGEKL